MPIDIEDVSRITIDFIIIFLLIFIICLDSTMRNERRDEYFTKIPFVNTYVRACRPIPHFLTYSFHAMENHANVISL